MHRDQWNPERSAGACFYHNSSSSASAITCIDHKWLLSPYPMQKSAVNSSCSLKRTHSQRENIFSSNKKKKKVEGGQHFFFSLLFFSQQLLEMFIPEYSFLSSALNQDIIHSPKKSRKYNSDNLLSQFLDLVFDKSCNQGHSDEGVLLRLLLGLSSTSNNNN